MFCGPVLNLTAESLRAFGACWFEGAVQAGELEPTSGKHLRWVMGGWLTFFLSKVLSTQRVWPPQSQRPR